MKFRTNYDNQDFQDAEVIKGESMTRPDTYEPLVNLIDRLTRTGGIPMVYMDDPSTFEDEEFDEYDDKIDVMQEGLEAHERVKAYNDNLSNKPNTSSPAEQVPVADSTGKDVSGEVKPDTIGTSPKDD